MKTELKKVYQCEYCTKRMLSAGAMSRHEKHCKARPENRHKCFDQCRFLVRNLELLDSVYDPENRLSYKTVFSCKSTDIKMYSYLLEKRMNFKPEFIKRLIRMPVKCNLHEYMNETELKDRFGIEIC